MASKMTTMVISLAMLAGFDRRWHRPLVNDLALDQVAGPARQQHVDRRLADHADARLRAAEDAGVGNHLALAEEAHPLEPAQAPVHELAGFLGAFLLGLGAVDDHDHALAVAHGRADEAVARLLGEAGLEAVGADVHLEKRVAVALLDLVPGELGLAVDRVIFREIVDEVLGEPRQVERGDVLVGVRQPG
jgi:uncharacterized protein YgfB (UPF0149 family)